MSCGEDVELREEGGADLVEVCAREVVVVVEGLDGVEVDDAAGFFAIMVSIGWGCNGTESSRAGRFVLWSDRELVCD